MRFNAYIYRMTADANLARLELDGVRVCFYGNTHVPGAWARAKRGFPEEFVEPTGVLDLGRYRAILVCPGSIGQPRDGVLGAAYAMYDRPARTVEWRRAEYDLGPLQARMQAMDFPPRLWQRLSEGR